jgi:hypothetical protein
MEPPRFVCTFCISRENINLVDPTLAVKGLAVGREVHAWGADEDPLQQTHKPLEMSPQTAAKAGANAAHA